MIEARNVVKYYKMGHVVVKALRGVSLRINKGDFAMIVGPSGSGKSTLLHLLSALDKPTSGKVLLEGRDLSLMDDWQLSIIRRKKLGFVFQSFNLIPTLNAVENVLIPTEPIKGPKEHYIRRAKALLQQVGLEDRMFHKPSELSGGEMQRVAIARALINDPQIVFADEPTGNLDSKASLMVIEIMKHLNEKQNKTFVIVTHDTSLLEFASKIFYLKDGRIERMEER
jgi:putative ABC transport system ATP-binding protein